MLNCLPRFVNAQMDCVPSLGPAGRLGLGFLYRATWPGAGVLYRRFRSQQSRPQVTVTSPAEFGVLTQETPLEGQGELPKEVLGDPWS